MLNDEKGVSYIYKDDIDEFLGIGMETLNQMNEPDIQKIERMVLECLEKSYFYLGEDGFRLKGGERRSPINMNVFETVMCVMRFLPTKEDSLKVQVRNAVYKLLDDEEFRENIGNHRDSAQRLGWRLEQAEGIGRGFEG